MARLVRLKFEDPGLRKLLLDTMDEEIVEVNHWHDTFWGVCRGCHHGCDGVGRNELGRILMEVREELRGSV